MSLFRGDESQHQQLMGYVNKGHTSDTPLRRPISKQKRKEIEEMFGKRAQKENVESMTVVETNLTGGSNEEFWIHGAWIFDPAGRAAYWWTAVVSLAFLYNFWVIIYRFAFEEVKPVTMLVWFTMDYHIGPHISSGHRVPFSNRISRGRRPSDRSGETAKTLHELQPVFRRLYQPTSAGVSVLHGRREIRPAMLPAAQDLPLLVLPWPHREAHELPQPDSDSHPASLPRGDLPLECLPGELPHGLLWKDRELALSTWKGGHRTHLPPIPLLEYPGTDPQRTVAKAGDQERIRVRHPADHLRTSLVCHGPRPRRQHRN